MASSSSLPEKLHVLRDRGLEALGKLPEADKSASSWIGHVSDGEQSARAANFNTYGFHVARDFVSVKKAAAMIGRMGDIVEEFWHPGDPEQPSAVFRTDSEQTSAQGSSDYFLDSADRIHFFAEKDALNEDGTVKTSEKLLALNKAGHGLHQADELFREYSCSDAIKDLVKDLGWNDPVIPQSMYIFKQPRIGGEVTSHQDSCFLHTEDINTGKPRQSCLGLWLALHDATVENGCLWVRPGSHKENLRRRFNRNPEHFAGDKSKPQMVFEENDDAPEIVWEGKLPDGSWPPPSEGLFANGFVPVECKAGDLVVFPGTLDHLSLPNYSDLPRHTFQLHLVEGEREGFKWSDTNWLQYSGEGGKFGKFLPIKK
ncbi:hypothetical protein TL16_g02580, partial [Triparma laevis f. inornata]|uniref:Phytanoyl-CoA dioxygenase n=2 Tax=Triparma laevis TaxID=1534972 RepID=A0A9W6ZHP4_9STRA